MLQDVEKSEKQKAAEADVAYFKEELGPGSVKNFGQATCLPRADWPG